VKKILSLLKTLRDKIEEVLGGMYPKLNSHMKGGKKK
jgi:hypothetical protein